MACQAKDEEISHYQSKCIHLLEILTSFVSAVSAKANKRQIRCCSSVWRSNLTVLTLDTRVSVSTHLPGVVLILALVLLHYAGEAAGVGGGAGQVLSLGDGRRPATHGQTTHLGHSEHRSYFPFQLFQMWTIFSPSVIFLSTQPLLLNSILSSKFCQVVVLVAEDITERIMRKWLLTGYMYIFPKHKEKSFKFGHILFSLLSDYNNTCSWWQEIQESCDWRSCLICFPVESESRLVSSGCWETPPGFGTGEGRHTAIP